MIPGEVRSSDEPLELNTEHEHRSLVIVNAGDRPIQIGSHLHLPDANPALSFDREQCQGFRLAVPAGTSVRFEPGVSRTVDLVALGGRGLVPGLQVRGRNLATYQREPKPVVPFGTPGTTVSDPSRASTVRARLSDERPHNDPDATAPADHDPDHGRSS
ncbi:urease subunit beta [Antricoccus suffuscus]|uniref:Urease subunit beta n=1 Tax=Antricoccus suffuscus TaxID=1629062 RepID=A0A2T1A5S2_9ACTN|nr:urease subunit beta [Antricoccus suffuscus]PRZ43939.1 urease subunit beta [Antricoccus suffuscus]